MTNVVMFKAYLAAQRCVAKIAAEGKAPLSAEDQMTRQALEHGREYAAALPQHLPAVGKVYIYDESGGIIGAADEKI